VRTALKDLEAFSLKSSEEINENIELLIECIDNNQCGRVEQINNRYEINAEQLSKLFAAFG